MLRILALALLAAAGCLDPLVGAECAPELDWCDGACRDLSTDRNNCGACGAVCDGACIDGWCADGGDDVTPGAGGASVGGAALVCDPDQQACAGQCVDPMTNPQHCGGCGVVCASGLCQDGSCLDLRAGHLVVIGHDLTTLNPAIERIVGNAVFTSPRRQVRVAVYEGSAAAVAIARADSVIAREADRRGRAWRRDRLTAADQLAGADVLLIHAQRAGTDASLRALGAAWRPAIDQFVAAGGVLIVLDGPAAHGGTHQILAGAELADIAGRNDVTAPTVAIAAPTDALASGVPLVYAAAASTVWFDTDTDDMVVGDGTRPVVLHWSVP
jgi:hypothetical protein